MYKKEKRMQLPQDFLKRMEQMLGQEYGEFLRTYEEPRRFGLRVNTLKISVDDFVKLAPFHLTPIPWTDDGFYYEREDDPARHPFYFAGLYYLQEPSAMTPASVLPVVPGEYVLDLCAAPGGKATALAAKLQGEGLLVANDISASRARALLKNIEVFGVKNSFVTNAVPAKLAASFGEAFDKILVDAPCSGEGMFRKDIANAKAWSLDKVEACAKLQREITGQAVQMLRPGGLMLYSTCTFAVEENEGTILHLLKTHPEMELLEIPWQEGYTHGFTLAKEWPTEKCIRIFPHKMGGEGHFMALLKKKGELPGVHGKAAKRGGRPSREEMRILQDFMEPVSMGWEAEQIEVRNGQAYFVPEQPPLAGSLPFLRNGLYLGEIRRGRFEPAQSFAMALKSGEYRGTIQFDYTDERVRRYLCGETVDADGLASGTEKGWRLVCVNGYPLGWGKLVNGTLKNKYHPGWRMIS